LNNSVCKKVVSMLSLYIDNKLSEDEKFFVENHLYHCGKCYENYIEMKNIISNLHYEYEKLLTEFERIEADKMFNVKEYETFYNNISPYIDDELCYNDSIKFRKYLLKSKPARQELSNAYNLKNNIKNSFTSYKNGININFSKRIINRLRDENKSTFDIIYKRASILLGIMIFSLLCVSFLMGYSYLNEDISSDNINDNLKVIEFPPDEDFIEFTFDEKNEALLTAK